MFTLRSSWGGPLELMLAAITNSAATGAPSKLGGRGSHLLREVHTFPARFTPPPSLKSLPRAWSSVAHAGVRSPPCALYPATL